MPFLFLRKQNFKIFYAGVIKLSLMELPQKNAELQLIWPFSWVALSARIWIKGI